MRSSLPCQSDTGTVDLRQAKPQGRVKARSSSSQPSTVPAAAARNEPRTARRARPSGRPGRPPAGPWTAPRRPPPPTPCAAAPSRSRGRGAARPRPASARPNSTTFSSPMPARKSRPSASYGATPHTTSAAANRSGRSAAQASACGPPPEAPPTSAVAIPKASSTATASGTTSATLRPGSRVEPAQPGRESVSSRQPRAWTGWARKPGCSALPGVPWWNSSTGPSAGPLTLHLQHAPVGDLDRPHALTSRSSPAPEGAGAGEEPPAPSAWCMVAKTSGSRHRTPAGSPRPVTDRGGRDRERVADRHDQARPAPGGRDRAAGEHGERRRGRDEVGHPHRVAVAAHDDPPPAPVVAVLPGQRPHGGPGPVGHPQVGGEPDRAAGPADAVVELPVLGAQEGRVVAARRARAPRGGTRRGRRCRPGRARRRSGSGRRRRRRARSSPSRPPSRTASCPRPP